jgi:tetratricopeptide (TPR) repeat protein
MLWNCSILYSFLLCCFISSASTIATAQASPATQSPNTFTALSRKADAARDSERLDEALVLYRKALALRPGWAEGWWSLGTISYDRSDYSEAAKDFQKVVALAPSNGTAFVMLGLSEFELGRDDLALKHIERGASLGLDKNPELHHVALYHEGVLLQRRGKFEGAKDALQQLCREGVHSDEAVVALGMTLLRQRSRTSPTAGSAEASIVSRVGQAGCLSGQSKFDEAGRQMREVVSQDSNYPGIHYAFGLVLVDASDTTEAVSQFKQEIENNPGDVVSRLQIASAMYKIDSAAGIPYAEEAVKLAPQQAFGHYLLGLLRLDVDKYQEAIPELELAEKGLPKEAKVYAALASAYSRAGRKQEAAKARATFARLNEQGKKSAQDVRSADDSGEARNPLSDSISVPQ